jgi:hypothetical protein
VNSTEMVIVPDAPFPTAMSQSSGNCFVMMLDGSRTLKVRAHLVSWRDEARSEIHFKVTDLDVMEAYGAS